MADSTLFYDATDIDSLEIKRKPFWERFLNSLQKGSLENKITDIPMFLLLIYLMITAEYQIILANNIGAMAGYGIASVWVGMAWFYQKELFKSRETIAELDGALRLIAQQKGMIINHVPIHYDEKDSP